MKQHTIQDRGAALGRTVLFAVLLSSTAFLSTIPLLSGCTGESDTDDGTAVLGGMTLSVTAPTIARDIAPGQKVSVVYSATGSISGLEAVYSPTADPDTDNISVMSGLAVGENQTFDLTASAFLVGQVYYVGVRATSSTGATLTRYAPATVRVNGPPKVSWGAAGETGFPTNPAVVAPGDIVAIKFNLNDPENNIDWTLFYDFDSVAGGATVTISRGTGNVGSVNWNTAGVAPGTYYVGLSYVDNVNNQGMSYAPATVQIVREPTITVTQPSRSTSVAKGARYQIVLSARDPSGSDDSTVDVFYDLDNILNGNEFLISQGLPVSTTAVTFDTTPVPVGNYYIGARIKGLVGTVSDYAPGVLSVIARPTINVTSPVEPLTVIQGQTVEVSFTNNVTKVSGKIDVFYQEDADGNGVGEGNAIALASGLKLETTKYAWDTENLSSKHTTDTFVVGVRLNLDDGGPFPTDFTAPITATRPVIDVTAPVQPTSVVQGQTVTVTFVNNAPGGIGTISAFYQVVNASGQLQGSEVSIAAGLPGSTTSIDWDTTNLSATQTAETFKVGVRLDLGDGKTPPVDYTAIITARIPNVNVLKAEPLDLVQGQKVLIEFSDNAAATVGKFAVYYQLDANADGVGEGSKIQVATNLPPTTTSYEWDTTPLLSKGHETETFVVGVQLDLGDGRTPREDLTPTIRARRPRISVTRPTAPTTITQGDKLTIGFTDEAPTGYGTIDVFYQVDSNSDGVGDGSPVTLASGLSGDVVSYVWNTTGLLSTHTAPNTFVVGVRFNLGDGRPTSVQPVDYTPTITVDTNPAITITDPVTPKTVIEGTKITIGFSGRVPIPGTLTPTIDVFYQTDANADGVGDGAEVLLATDLSAASTTSVVWDTLGVVPASASVKTFVVGARLDPGDGSGLLTDYSAVITVNKPLITLTKLVVGTQEYGPDNNLTVGQGTKVTMQFTNTALANTAKIEAFYQVDANADGVGEGKKEVFAKDLALTTTSAVWDTTGLAIQPTNTFVLGVQLNMTGTLVDNYPVDQTGIVTVSARPVIELLKPAVDENRESLGILKVKYRIVDQDSTMSVRILLDADRTPDSGNEILLVERQGVATHVFEEEIDVNLTTLGLGEGLYYFFLDVKDEYGGPAANPNGFYAPQTGGDGYITLHSLASGSRRLGVYWLEDIESIQPQRRFPAAVFQGHNFEDNAGADFLALGDINRDGYDDFMVLSRFGKPQWVNPSGVGRGEANLIYGKATTTSNEGPYKNPQSFSQTNFTFDLNSVGSTLLNGSVVTGVAPVPTTPAQTEGMQSATTLGDLNSDGYTDVAFGFPSVNSSGRVRHCDLYWQGKVGIELNATKKHMTVDCGYIVKPGQFLNGGLVFLSGASGIGTNGTVVDLTSAGMGFTRVNPADNDPYAVSLYTKDMYAWRQPQTAPSAHVLQAYVEKNGAGLLASKVEVIFNVQQQNSPSVWANMVGIYPVVTVNAGESFNPVDTRQDLDNDPANNLQYPTFADLSAAVQAQSLILPPPDGLGGWLLNNDCTGNTKAFRVIPMGMRIDLVPYTITITDPDNDPRVRVTGCGGIVRYRVDAATLTLSAAGNDRPPPTYPTGCELIESEGGTLKDDKCNEAINWDVTLLGGFPTSGQLAEPVMYDDMPPNDYLYWAYMNSPPCECNAVVNMDPVVVPQNNGGIYNSGFATGNVNTPGARIIGEGTGNRFGTRVSQHRTTTNETVDTIFVTAPLAGAAGMAYYWELKGSNRNLWDNTNDIKPFMYQINNPVDINAKIAVPLSGNEGDWQYTATTANFDIHTVTGPRLTDDNPDSSLAVRVISLPAGRTGPIADIKGIPDFNNDTRGDVMLSAPNVFSNDGAVYIIYRRALSLEGSSIDLTELEANRSSPSRLAGVMIRGDFGSGANFGASVVGIGDFNRDGFDDVAVGSPGFDGGRGEVVVVLGGSNLISPGAGDADAENGLPGYTVQRLVNEGFAFRIQGARAGDNAAFNVGAAGDFDGDGEPDLLIAAPGATPQFDSNVDGVLDTDGIDYNGDGTADVVTTHYGATVNTGTDLVGAGAVYVIYGSNNLTGSISLSRIGSPELQGVMYVGRRAGHKLGGGIEAKKGTRSSGFGSAGDINNDGADDILISAILADPDDKTNAGEAYLVLGRKIPAP